jgi:CelD/BcsL family acetyltransferase involved in cellulose biosynthesis
MKPLIETITSTPRPTSATALPEAARAATDNVPAMTGKLKVEVICEVAGLAEYFTALEELAAAAMEPNVFYEPWMLIPALQAFGDGEEFLFVLITAPDAKRKAAAPALHGFFPLVRRRRYKGLPVHCLTLWSYKYSSLCTPLLSAARAQECLAVFFDWLATAASGAPLMEFGDVSGEGPFHQLLVNHFSERATFTYSQDAHTRAVFRPAENAEAYLQTALAGDYRRRIRRQERRLAETGLVEYVIPGHGEELNDWVEEFLRLEASGWKGREGSAIAAQEMDRSFFIEVMNGAARRQRLRMIALLLDGRPIAQEVFFVAGPGSFAFKIGYDEQYAKFSPGILLELEIIRFLHSRPEIQWMDSCSTPDSFMNRLWRDRRTIRTVVASTGRSPGDLIVSLMPLLKWLKRRLRSGSLNTPSEG